VKKTVDPLEDASGYSGYVAFVRTSNGWPGEIQINIGTIIYAKEKEQVARSVLGEAEFNRIKMLYGLDCGWGHGFYEFSRKPGSDAVLAKKAMEASKDYYAYFRSPTPNPVLKQRLLNTIGDLDLGQHH